MYRKNRQITEYFAPNDLANIAAEAAVLAPWLEDTLPRINTLKMSRGVFHEIQAQYTHHMPDAVKMLFTMVPGKRIILILESSCEASGEWTKRQVQEGHYLKTSVRVLAHG